MSGTVTIRVRERSLVVPAGVTLGAALLAAGELVLGRRPRDGRPRGLFCGMGVCHDCVVTVNGVAGVRACVTEVEDGMSVKPGP